MFCSVTEGFRRFLSIMTQSDLSCKKVWPFCGEWSINGGKARVEAGRSMSGYLGEGGGTRGWLVKCVVKLEST